MRRTDGAGITRIGEFVAFIVLRVPFVAILVASGRNRKWNELVVIRVG